MCVKAVFYESFAGSGSKGFCVPNVDIGHGILLLQYGLNSFRINQRWKYDSYCNSRRESVNTKTIFFRLLELGGVNRSGAFRLDASGKAVNAARVLHQLAPGSCVNVSPLGEENSALFLSLADNDALPVVSVSIPGRTRFCYTLLELFGENHRTCGG